MFLILSSTLPISIFLTFSQASKCQTAHVQDAPYALLAPFIARPRARPDLRVRDWLARLCIELVQFTHSCSQTKIHINQFNKIMRSKCLW